MNDILAIISDKVEGKEYPLSISVNLENEYDRFDFAKIAALIPDNVRLNCDSAVDEYLGDVVKGAFFQKFVTEGEEYIKKFLATIDDEEVTDYFEWHMDEITGLKYASDMEDVVDVIEPITYLLTPELWERVFDFVHVEICNISDVLTKNKITGQEMVGTVHCILDEDFIPVVNKDLKTGHFMESTVMWGAEAGIYFGLGSGLLENFNPMDFFANDEQLQKYIDNLYEDGEAAKYNSAIDEIFEANGNKLKEELRQDIENLKVIFAKYLKDKDVFEEELDDALYKVISICPPCEIISVDYCY